MKRSEINAALRWAVDLLTESRITLPRFAYWDMDQWRANRDRIDALREVMQGWDVSDFGSGNFHRVGAVLFTVRNGSHRRKGVGTPYAEKYILLEEGQFLPLHYHASKVEDIINRGGGVLSMYLYNKLPDGSPDRESDVIFYSDGIAMTAKAGEEVLISRGNSVSLTPYLYHRFGAKRGYGPLIVGEVSSINDDATDNHFAETIARYAKIEENEQMLYPLCNEYHKI